MYGDPNYFTNNSWNASNFVQPMQANAWAPQLKTNKILVTSLDEAIAKSGERHSEVYYWDQNKPVIYVVRTDMNGAKSWAQLQYSTPNQENNAPATKADITAIFSRLETLAAKLESFDAAKPTTVAKRKKTENPEPEVASDVESNG